MFDKKNMRKKGSEKEGRKQGKRDVNSKHLGGGKWMQKPPSRIERKVFFVLQKGEVREERRECAIVVSISSSSSSGVTGDGGGGDVDAEGGANVTWVCVCVSVCVPPPSDGTTRLCAHFVCPTCAFCQGNIK